MSFWKMIPPKSRPLSTSIEPRKPAVRRPLTKGKKVTAVVVSWLLLMIVVFPTMHCTLSEADDGFYDAIYLTMTLHGDLRGIDRLIAVLCVIINVIYVQVGLTVAWSGGRE